MEEATMQPGEPAMPAEEAMVLTDEGATLAGVPVLLSKAPVRPCPRTDDNSYQAFDDLWQDFAACRSVEARNRLVVAYLPLVRRMVKTLPRHVRSYWDDDDLTSFGMIGLLDAVERWVPVARFETYAATRIRGAIYDELRRLDHLPRRLRRQLVEYQRAEEHLVGRLGRIPVPTEVLEAVSIPPGPDGDELLAAVCSAQVLHIQHGSALDADDDGIELFNCIESWDPEPNAVGAAALAEVRRAISRLPASQQRVVRLHYLDGLTQEQVARLIGVSNSRVSQITSAAVRSLRVLLGADEAKARAS
jgi:RNA polymerase sigma factor for flagellar operon FliA